MRSMRTPASSVAVLVASMLLSACGGGSREAVATGPSQSPGPPTTPVPTATASPSAHNTPTPSPTATPTPVPVPSGGGIIPSGDPDGAKKLGQYLYPTSPGIACGARTGHYDACPVTSRLASRLDGNPTPHAEPLCRCQNTWQKSEVTTTQTPDPTVWIVHVVLTFGPGVTVTIDVRALRTDQGWLGDDTTCTGQGEQSSIYTQSPPPCPGP